MMQVIVTKRVNLLFWDAAEASWRSKPSVAKCSPVEAQNLSGFAQIAAPLNSRSSNSSAVLFTNNAASVKQAADI